MQNARLTPTKRKAKCCKTQNKMLHFADLGETYYLTSKHNLQTFRTKITPENDYLAAKNKL